MPDWAQHVRPRLSSLRFSPTRESEIVEELSQHLEDRWRELVASGAHEDEATRLALAEFREGNLLARSMTPLRQAHAPAPLAPGAPAGHVLGDLWQDLRYAVRLYLRQAGFTIAAVLSLALGIGVNTTMFTIVHGVLLRDLPYPEPDKLMRLVQAHSGGEVTMREYQIVKQHARTFEAVAAYRGIGERRLGRAEDQNWITTVAITTDFLRTFGVQPQIGREFTDEETRSGGPSAIILSDEVWRRVFDADPRILGRTIALNDTSATVVGVLPAGFWFPQEVDAALPLRNTGALDDTGTNTSLIARLRSDTTIARAQSELGTMTEQILTVARAHLARDYRGLVALGFRDWVAGDVRENLLLLFGATGVLLLIACGNLALLLLTRSAARARELAVRAALGSSQRRTLAQLLTENLFLAAIGAVVGVVAAHALVRVFVSISPFALPTSAPLTVSGTVLGFTAVTALTTSVLITLVPFLSSRRLNIARSRSALKERTLARAAFARGHVMRSSSPSWVVDDATRGRGPARSNAVSHHAARARIRS